MAPALVSLLLIGLVFSRAAFAAEIEATIAVERLDILQPRSFGYRIGDKFSRVIHLQLRKPNHLQVDDMPAAGRLGDWLTLEAPAITQRDLGVSTSYDIHLTYQIVNVLPEVTDIPVPHHYLPYGNDEASLKVLVPAVRIGVSALRQGDHHELQPDHRPWQQPFSYFTAVLCGLLLLLSLLAIVYLYWGLPRTQQRPFMETYRRIRKSPRQHADYHDTLQVIHQAFNRTAGKTVFADGLVEFFNEHPHFAGSRELIEEFFLRSRRHFFDGVATVPDTRFNQEQLIAFVRRCADIERGLA